MTWQHNSKRASQAAYDTTYAAAIAEGYDAAEAEELAQEAADDMWRQLGSHDIEWDEE